MRTKTAAAFAIALALACCTGLATSHAQDRTPGSPGDIAFWNSVKDAKNPAEIRAYLQAYPNGTFADLARIRLQSLQGGPANPPPSPRPSSTGSVLTNTATIREVQDRLYNLNYAVSVSGRLTEERRNAIREWQGNTRRPVTGDMDEEQLAGLRAARAATIWGALAYSVKGASATVWNRSSRQEAERDAVAECRKKGGGTCRVVTAAEKACGALGFYTGRVRSTQHWGVYASIRPTLAQAVDNALSECRRQARRSDACGVRLTFCADGSHKQ